MQRIERAVSRVLQLTLAVWSFAAAAAAELEPLRTAAALSARPTACSMRSPDTVTVWQGARIASGGLWPRLCATLSSAGRLLPTEPKAATELVQRSAELAMAGERWIGPPALETPFRLLRARVSLVNGEAAEAREMFHRISTELPISEWDPATLRDFAVSSVTVGRYEEAAAIYRRLIAVSSWLPRGERLAVRIEAAMAVMRLSDPDAVEALGYLSALSEDSDSTVAALLESLRTLAQHMNVATSTPAGSTLETLPTASRRLARLSEHDWRLVESWHAWLRARDPELWKWAHDPTVPASYRAFAIRLTSGG